LLKIATPDSIARSKLSNIDWKKISEQYFEIHSYTSLATLLNKCFKKAKQESVSIQITTHGALLQSKSRASLKKVLPGIADVMLMELLEFKTETGFCYEIK